VSLLGTLLKTVTVRPSYGSHPRLSILGQIEARLYCADRVILGAQRGDVAGFARARPVDVAPDAKAVRPAVAGKKHRPRRARFRAGGDGGGSDRHAVEKSGRHADRPGAVAPASLKRC